MTCFEVVRMTWALDGSFFYFFLLKPLAPIQDQDTQNVFCRHDDSLDFQMTTFPLRLILPLCLNKVILKHGIIICVTYKYLILLLRKFSYPWWFIAPIKHFRSTPLIHDTVQQKRKFTAEKRRLWLVTKHSPTNCNKIPS